MNIGMGFNDGEVVPQSTRSNDHRFRGCQDKFKGRGVACGYLIKDEMRKEETFGKEDHPGQWWMGGVVEVHTLSRQRNTRIVSEVSICMLFCLLIYKSFQDEPALLSPLKISQRYTHAQTKDIANIQKPFDKWQQIDDFTMRPNFIDR